MAFGKGGIPHIGTHDGRTVRYPDPEIKVRLGLAALWGWGWGWGWHLLRRLGKSASLQAHCHAAAGR